MARSNVLMTICETLLSSASAAASNALLSEGVIRKARGSSRVSFFGGLEVFFTAILIISDILLHYMAIASRVEAAKRDCKRKEHGKSAKRSAAIERHVAKITSSLGVTVTNTDEAEAAHRSEAALHIEHARYARAILDLNQEFALRQDQLRAFHLQRVSEIVELGG